MSWIILLDSGPLGLATNPNASPEAKACNQWLQNQITKGRRVLVPDICDYEVRRELLRANKTNGVMRLDALRSVIGHAPMNYEVLLAAANFWAQARRMGKPTAPDPALDGDMILCGHSMVLVSQGELVTIATTNVKHLSLFADAQEWKSIT